MNSAPHIVFLGLGYSARYVADALHAQGWHISGTARSDDGVGRIERNGWHGIKFDGAAPSSALATALTSVTHILASIPPDADGDPAIRHHAADLRAAQQLRWIGYFSTVGVYGDAAGDWVDESTPCQPSSVRGQRRLAAERDWQSIGVALGCPVAILRLPGIYGPGRSAFDAVRAGTARRIVKPGQVFNRIHVEDIARATLAAIARPERDGVYNVTDDHPSPPQDVTVYAAELLDVPPPPEVAFDEAQMTPMARSFYGESKKVSNRRMKAELGVTLKYPTYREGLAALLSEALSAD